MFTNPVNNSGGEIPSVSSSEEHDQTFWIEWLIETLAFDGQPMLITTLVNSAVQWGNYSNGGLIRSGRLQRVGRKFVSISPKNPG